MRLIRSLVGMVVLALAVEACFDAPHFPDQPQITFNDVIFRDLPQPDQADTLIVTVNFKDGDGDLGLDESETRSPYNDKYYYVFSNGSFLNYAARRNIAGYDTLPAFVSPYNCTNWEVIRDPDTNNVMDTLYFTLNPDHFNFFVDFYIQETIAQKDSMVFFDWKTKFPYPGCNVNGFYGRFPILSKDVTQKTAQEGKIKYSMKSVGFAFFFGVKVLQMRIFIQDRALHKSNVITTDKFTLPGIRK